MVAIPVGILIISLSVISTVVAQKNVLFLVSDDLKPALGSYQSDDPMFDDLPPFITPNLDNLAAKSLLLKRAYCQHAVCSPSRASFMTGRRPDTTHVYNLTAYWREVGGNFTTIPQYFKENGYRSLGMGKIFHPENASGFDDPISWTDPYYHAPSKDYYYQKNNSWLAVSPADREALPLPDDYVIDRAIQWIQNYSVEPPEERQPFFLALGLLKPHLPFIFPEEYLDFYPMENIEMPSNYYAPIGMPSMAWSKFGEIRGYDDIAQLNVSGEVNTTFPDDITLDLRRAYFASVTYIDDLVGDLLRALDETGLVNDTIITFFGDHGFHLGENGEWGKHTNFDQAALTPMMLFVPGKTESGVVTEHLVELVDLYPTLVEAAGLPAMSLCPEQGVADVSVCREGDSLMPLIDNPETVEWKDRVFFQYPKGGVNNRAMGYAIKTDRYRYTAWVGFTGEPDYLPVWEDVRGLELYDHLNDPRENLNVVDDDQYSEVVTDLHDKLMAGWRAVVQP